MRTPEFKPRDIVEACGTRFIIVEVVPSRPANPYVAIKERGNGAKYKLGHKHFPRKVGEVPEDHYMLKQTAFRDFDRLGNESKKMLRGVLQAVIDESDNAVVEATRLLTLIGG